VGEFDARRIVGGEFLDTGRSIAMQISNRSALAVESKRILLLLSDTLIVGGDGVAVVRFVAIRAMSWLRWGSSFSTVATFMSTGLPPLGFFSDEIAATVFLMRFPAFAQLAQHAVLIDSPRDNASSHS